MIFVGFCTVNSVNLEMGFWVLTSISDVNLEDKVTLASKKLGVPNSAKLYFNEEQ